MQEEHLTTVSPNQKSNGHYYIHKCPWHSSPEWQARSWFLFPALLLPEKIQHDSALSTQGHQLNLQYSEPQWELWPCLENQTAENFEGNVTFYCGTDPLPNLCLVPLWKDVNVRLKRTGLDDSFVSEGNKQRRNTDEDSC